MVSEQGSKTDGTRWRIIDCAAELFAESGYGNVSVADVVARAVVSRGAFNYHFPTKESLAAALIRYFDSAMRQKGREVSSESASNLENLIRASFAQQNLILQDVRVRVGMRLGNAMDQICSLESQSLIPTWSAIFVTGMAGAVSDGDIDGDVDPRAVGYALGCGIVGNSLMSFTGVDPIQGLEIIWRNTLRGILTARSELFFDQLLQRMAAQYTRNN